MQTGFEYRHRDGIFIEEKERKSCFFLSVSFLFVVQLRPLKSKGEREKEREKERERERERELNNM